MDGTQDPTRVAMRPPEQVMRLSRMGNFHPMRLSFMRILLRRVKAEGWQVSRPVWDIDDSGVGRAVYTATGPDRAYSLIVYSHDLPDHLRSDRVIAEAWDATFTLYDGVPTQDDLDRLQNHVPVQEAGRLSIRELTLSRANRSVRLFKHVLDALSTGQQPDAQELGKVGYLMRTTAVYGSGKFGLADREVYSERPELTAPFQAEMLTVWLIRTFSIDIVEHMARVKGGSDAVRLDPDLRRSLGIGNSTGLGMAPFLMTHPVLIHHWIAAREQAFARVRAVPQFTAQHWQDFRAALDFAMDNIAGWYSEHPIQIEKLKVLRADMDTLAAHVESFDPDIAYPAQALWQWAEAHLGEDAQEQLVSLLLEPFGDLIDDLADEMSADERAPIALGGAQTVGAVLSKIDALYDWALECDWASSAETARLWYVSAEKLEPRLAERADEPLEPYEQPLAPAREVAALRAALKDCDAATSMAAFLQDKPEHREAVRRVQITAHNEYSEIRDNTVAAHMLPIDLLRAKLSFFGATRFDPRSDRWVRITMFNNAPFPDEIHQMDGDAWMYGIADDRPAASSRRTTAHPPTPALRRAATAGVTETGWSLGEVASLAAKAARGAGLPWGVAADAARAVRRLSEHGLPGEEAMALDLRQPVPGETVLIGCALADSATMDGAKLYRPVVPILLAACLQDCVASGDVALLHGENDEVLGKVSREGFEGFQQEDFAPCVVRISIEVGTVSERKVGRIDRIEPAVLECLNALAARTYAPATEASRTKGAGAGVLDND